MMFHNKSIRIAVLLAAILGVARPALAENVGTVTNGGLIADTSTWIAYSTNYRGNLGFAIGYRDEYDARQAAQSGCGLPDCKIVMKEKGVCGAFAESLQGGYWFGIAYGNDYHTVRKIALGGCESGAPAGSCIFRHSDCSR